MENHSRISIVIIARKILDNDEVITMMMMINNINCNNDDGEDNDQ